MNLQEKFKQFQLEGKLSSSPPKESNTLPNTGNTILLVDAMNQFIRNFAANSAMNEDGEHMGGVTGFLLSIGTVIRQFKVAKVYVVFDGKGGSTKRRDLFPDYKENRRFMTKLNRTYDFQTLEEEVESRKKQYDLLMALLMNLPVTVIQIDGVEADDKIAYLAQIAEERERKSIIMSNDKDYLQLVSDYISVWNPVKKKLYTPIKVVEDYGFHPNNFVLYRAITGDSSDCIPGVKGIGEKTVLKYFPELVEDSPKDINFIIESATSQLEQHKKPPVALQTLVNSKSQLELNYKLMRLDDVAMSGYNRSEVITWYDRPPNEYNKTELTKIIRMNKLIQAFGNYESWLNNTFVPLTRYKLSW